MARSDVELLIKATDKASKQIDRINKGVKKLGDESEKTGKKVKKSSGGFKDLQANWTKLAIAGAAAAGALYTIKKAYDFAKQGAVIKQTANSWDMLLDKVGAAPDLLDQLSDASRGTVDDMTIMSSTALVLAGTSGELATNIAAATPELMAIAKAANKLNPQLGTTSFMYQSIATGVKRAQPLILDNLGLTIKVGSANEAMAKSLGKSVEELTAEEKSMAILNDTLRAGQVLIGQVGGTTESATDDFEAFEAMVKNLSDTFKMKSTPAIREGVAVLNELLGVLTAQIDVTYTLDQATKLGIITSEEMLIMRRDLRTGTLELAEAEVIVNQKLKEYWDTLKESAPDVESADRAMLNFAGTLKEESIPALDNAEQSVKNVAFALGDVTNAQIAAVAIKEVQAAWEAGTIEGEDYILMMQDIGLNILDLDEAQVTSATKFYEWQVAMSETELELQDVITATKGAIGWIGKLEGKTVHIKFKISTSGKIPKLGGKDKTAIEAYGGQHGLDIIVPPGYNETGGRPFMFAAESGERVTISTEEQQRSSVINNFNLTANYEERDRSSLAQDVKMLATVYG